MVGWGPIMTACSDKPKADLATMARQFLVAQADKGTPVASALGQAGAASTAHTGGSVETATRERKKKDKKEKKVCHSQNAREARRVWGVS